MLNVEGLRIEVGGEPLVAGLELAVEGGQCVGLTGPSGSGKPTVLRTLAGRIDAVEGTIRLDGRSPAEVGWPRFRRSVLYTAQRPVMFPGSVAENLRRPFEYASADRSFPTDEARDLFDRLGLEGERIDQEGETLSVGQQQRVALIRAMLVRPRFLLLDEPTSALDDDAATRVESLLGVFLADGGGAVLVSHDGEQVERLCHTRVSLEGGRR